MLAAGSITVRNAFVEFLLAALFANWNALAVIGKSFE